MQTHIFTYKCRRCGETHNGSQLDAPSNAGAMVLLVNAGLGVHSEPMAPGMFHIHICSDAGVGLSDLIGFDTKPSK